MISPISSISRKKLKMKKTKNEKVSNLTSWKQQHSKCFKYLVVCHDLTSTHMQCINTKFINLLLIYYFIYYNLLLNLSPLIYITEDIN